VTTNILFHVTSEGAAVAILREGFQDGTGTYMTDRDFSGVWLSDRPLDENESAWGDVVLMVRFSVPLTALADFEWIERASSTANGLCLPNS
jgi:hypothetical protein